MPHSDILEHADAIAIIGLAGRFPGASDLDTFWRNLRDGVESITFFSDRELEAAGIDPERLRDRHYVKASGVLDDIDAFDAAFFGMNPREAEITDPQHRLFLEAAWAAIEHAGYHPDTYDGSIGLYAGVGLSTYMFHLYADHDLVESVGRLQLRIGNDKDFLPTRVSYKLNLQGPSVSVQTACSTSLVAIHLACQSLLTSECDMALAGGARIRVPGQAGYLYREGGILSPDGHCRTFDAQAQGTIGGDGVGAVVLKRLPDALADGDCIHAVIRGSAINNDGAGKVGYTAPSVAGQAAVIAEALAMADVDPKTITYIESHGTATPLGDPIEIAALTRAFRAHTTATGFCAVGSVKTNVGHLDAAAGVAGFIKTVLALQHRMIPPSLHFEQPNPQIDFANSPFYVNTATADWPVDQAPRRAGVSSFGIGGTNAHVVLEEAPIPDPSGPTRPWQLLLLSAKTSSALDTATTNLVEHLKAHPELNSADVAFTLQCGRKTFNHRRMVVCQDLTDGVKALETSDPARVWTEAREGRARPITFMFPGQGTQYVQMARELYQTEPIFREWVDTSVELLKPYVEFDVREVLYPEESDNKAAAQQLQQTAVTQPALFIIEYALARQWMAWGIHPEAMIGHSIGEYVAACLADVFSLEEALALVAARGQLMQRLPGGTMLAVSLPEHELKRFLDASVSLAAVNGPSLCVVSGPREAIELCEARLAANGAVFRRLDTSHAFHSAMMDPVVASFEARVAQINLSPPKCPFVSTLTETWITEAEATDPHYWAQHLRHTVRFAQGLETLLAESDRIYLEIGPRQTLSALVRQQATSADVIPSLHSPHEPGSDVAFLLAALGRLWLAGVEVDWAGFYAHERRRRLPLPTYPFERQRYWIDPPRAANLVNTHEKPLSAKSVPAETRKIEDWFYAPTWTRANLPASSTHSLQDGGCWLVFLDTCGLGNRLVQRLEAMAQEVIIVQMGAGFANMRDGRYTLNPKCHDDYVALLQELHLLGKVPNAIVHLWLITSNDYDGAALENLEHVQDIGLYSLLSLVQVLGQQHVTEKRQISVLSNGMQPGGDVEVLHPTKATILGACKVIPQEYPNLICRSIDVTLLMPEADMAPRLVDQLINELIADQADRIVAYRGGERWVQTFEPVRLSDVTDGATRVRDQGVYLITGGLGGIGLTLAEHLAQQVQAKLILVGRSAVPARDDWEVWLSTHGDHDRMSQVIRKLEALEALGAEVWATSADVANVQQMQAVIVQAEARFGRIHGIIHAAGIPDGAVIQRRTHGMTKQILAPKVQGTLVLDQLYQSRDLDFFLLCSSLASILAPVGQVGYVAANAFLDAFAHHQTARDGRHTVSVNWDTWQEVGMAVETRQPAPVRAVAHPLFDHRFEDPPNREVYVSQLRTDTHWVLHEHRLGGQAILPGTAYLEMARATVADQARNRAMEMHQVYFLSPLIMGERESRDVHTILTQDEDGLAFTIKSRSSPGDDAWQEHARGQITWIEGISPKWHDIADLSRRCDGEAIAPSGTVDEGRVQSPAVGPRWNNLLRAQRTANQGFALIELPEAFAADLESYLLHPALLDRATGFLVPAVRAAGMYLPFSYQTIKIWGPLPRRFFCYSRYVEPNSPRKETLQFHITLMDEQGVERVDIEAYTLRKIDRERVLAPSTAGQRPALDPSSQRSNFRADIQSPGNLETLRLIPAQRRSPGPGEVEIAVCTAGLNFKDVLTALGMMPHASGERMPLGLECAGTIVALGEGVENVAIGDDVMALASSCFGSFVTTGASAVARKPNHLSFEEAATIPVAFLTAYHALVQLARLSPNERVLIHTATGGVGMAAVQVARWMKADIFATAGSETKRAYLRDLGIEHVMDSRSLAFADEIMRHTDGVGVDVVLNALAGAFISKGLEILAPYGRFLEIGMRDIDSNTPLGLKPFEKSLAFFAIQVGPNMPHFRALWHDVMQHVEARHFHPLPYQVFPSTEMARAFDFMAQAKHIGKIVLAFEPSTHVATTHTHIYPGPPAPTHHGRRERLQSGLLPREGVEVFDRVLGSTWPQLFVSTQDLNTRMAQRYAARTERFQGAFETMAHDKRSHVRPDLKTPYLAPQTAIEQTLVGIWQDLLGIKPIGINDDFLELGGHSLLAIQVLSRVRDSYQLDLPLALLFETPTVAAIASVVSQSHHVHRDEQTNRITRVERDESAELLAKLDQLSDTEVDALLRARLANNEDKD